ncbi:MAG: hypothetical protein ABI438_08175 [Dermatophilaceae bacterium]
MSAWTTVLDEAEARGGTPAQVASRLGLSTSLVQAVLDHAERLGVVAIAGSGCGSGCPTGPEMPKACAGCPLTVA